MTIDIPLLQTIPRYSLVVDTVVVASPVVDVVFQSFYHGLGQQPHHDFPDWMKKRELGAVVAAVVLSLRVEEQRNSVAVAVA